MSTSRDTDNLKIAVQHAMGLLSKGESDLAREQAEEILRQFPDEINSKFILAAVMRATGNNVQALRHLSALVQRAPDFALAQQELGFAYAEAGQPMEAIEALRKAVATQHKLPGTWKLLVELFLAEEDQQSAAEASIQFLLASSENPDLIQAVQLVRAGKIAQAETICRKFLQENPTNVTAIRLLADIAIKIGVLDDAEKLLVRCLELAPSFDLARLNYADVLSKREKLEPALTQIDQLLEAEPSKFALLVLRGSILVKMGDFARALPLYERLLGEYPPRPMITLVYGHALKTVGKQDQAIDAYRQTIDLRPSFGDAYWSLANLKTFRFEDRDIRAMREEINKSGCTREDHFHLCFALGKALEDRQEYEESFRFYDLGNSTKEKLEGYSATATTELVDKMKSTFTVEFFSMQSGQGCADPDPIFVVGLPRSGSTLLEQILASHSQVDGTKELVHIPALVRRLSAKKKSTERSQYPEILTQLSGSQLQELGREYLQQARIQRGNAPYFIDKMPNNFIHVGLISLILPNAKIIDARRHPMAACFSAFTQLFARGQAFTYGLENIGRYYCDYVNVMDHWDQVLPGKILRVQYEEVVAETETQIRRILEYCELPFEEACLHFYETDRAVRTASSEQVRLPIYGDAVDHWKNFDPYLTQLKEALVPVLNR